MTIFSSIVQASGTAHSAVHEQVEMRMAVMELLARNRQTAPGPGVMA